MPTLVDFSMTDLMIKYRKNNYLDITFVKIKFNEQNNKKIKKMKIILIVYVLSTLIYSKYCKHHRAVIHTATCF